MPARSELPAMKHRHVGEGVYHETLSQRLTSEAGNKQNTGPLPGLLPIHKQKPGSARLPQLFLAIAAAAAWVHPNVMCGAAPA
jgi:hypothetical protein